MSEAQRAALNQMLQSGPDFAELPVADMRSFYDQLGAITTMPDHVRLMPDRASGVPVEIGKGSGTEGNRTILFLHGGGYVIGSIASHRGMVASLGDAARARTVAVDYRLAPEHPFPAPLEDGLAAYKWLLNSGTEPRNIAIVGDSAGGGMAIAVMLSAREQGLPMPACSVLFSPFVDLGGTGETMELKAHDDVSVSFDVLRRLSGYYLGGEDYRNPLISPINADLRGLPPLLVFVGTSEVLLDDSIRLARRAMIDDVSVRFEAWPRLPHVWPLFSGILDEGRDALEAAGAWIFARTG